MFPSKAHLALALALTALGACHARAPSAPDEAARAEADYVAPPSVVSVAADADGVRLGGLAPPGASVRLAEPGGQARLATADAAGRWRLRLPPSTQARIFGLSARSGSRQVQAEGYVLVGPGGQAALLRAGAGALRIDRRRSAGVAVMDFDEEGVTLLSGFAPAGTDVALSIDGRPAAPTRAGADGRFSLALSRLSAGVHRIEASGVGFTDSVTVHASPAEPLVAGPLHSQLIAGGLRADWLTPGGGVQSTILTG